MFHVPVPAGAPLTVPVDRGYTEARWIAPERVHELAIGHELWRIEQALEALRTGRCLDLFTGVPLPATPYAAPTSPAPSAG